jgi:exosortase/archaeosortase family protein
MRAARHVTPWRCGDENISRPTRDGIPTDDVDVARGSGESMDVSTRDSEPQAVDTARSRLRFAVSFGVIAAVLFLAYAFPYAEHGMSEAWFDGYLAFYARVAGTVLSLFDPRVTVHQSDILGAYDLRIVKNCDAMEANILYVAAVLAFPVELSARFAGLAAGVLLLIAVNVLRICTLYYVGVVAPRAFPFFHLELWPLLLIAAGASIFLVWATLSTARPPPKGARAAL